MIINDYSSNCDAQALLQNFLRALNCPKGRFYPDKNYGRVIEGSNALQELMAYVRQTAEEFDGVYVKSMDICGDYANIQLLINDEERQVSIAL